MGFITQQYWNTPLCRYFKINFDRKQLLLVTYIVRWKELINNFICQFVDIFIFMILKLLHFFQTCGLEINKCYTVQSNMTRNTNVLKPWRYRRDLPPHSSIRLAMVSASSSAIFRILLRPSRTTCTTWASFTVSRLQNGGITCFSIRWATCRQRPEVSHIGRNKYLIDGSKFQFLQEIEIFMTPFYFKKRRGSFPLLLSKIKLKLKFNP